MSRGWETLHVIHCGMGSSSRRIILLQLSLQLPQLSQQLGVRAIHPGVDNVNGELWTQAADTIRTHQINYYTRYHPHSVCSDSLLLKRFPSQVVRIDAELCCIPLSAPL